MRCSPSTMSGAEVKTRSQAELAFDIRCTGMHPHDCLVHSTITHPRLSPLPPPTLEHPTGTKTTRALERP